MNIGRYMIPVARCQATTAFTQPTRHLATYNSEYTHRPKRLVRLNTMLPPYSSNPIN